MRCRCWPRIRDALYWQKQLLRRRGHCQCLFRRIASITQPCEDQIGIHRIAQRNLGNRNTRCSRLETDRPLSSSVQSRFVRRATPSRKYLYPSRTLSHTLKSQQAVRPDAYGTLLLTTSGAVSPASPPAPAASSRMTAASLSARGACARASLPAGCRSPEA